MFGDDGFPTEEVSPLAAAPSDGLQLKQGCIAEIGVPQGWNEHMINTVAPFAQFDVNESAILLGSDHIETH